MERATSPIRFVLPFFFTFLLAAYAGPLNTSNLKGNGSVEPILDPEEIRSLTTPPPSHLYDNWKDWETWEASPEIITSFPYYRSGYDEDGLVVYVVEFGKWNYRELSRKPQEKIQEFWKYFEQYVLRVERDSAENNHQGTAFILDWDCFYLREYASATALKLALQMFAGLVRVDHAFKYGFYINVNFAAETFLNMARPFMGNLLEKNEICGPQTYKWKPKLLKKIPANQLPPKFGGDEGWQALPLNPSRR